MIFHQKAPLETTDELSMYQDTFGDFNIEEEIEKAKNEIETAYMNFQNVLDPDLIDCYIYEGNAAWKRYRFLLRQAKKMTE